MSAADDLGKEPDRFDLEQAIMACWTTSDDMELAASSIANTAKVDDAALVDQIVTLLNGLKELHDMRCSRVMDIFTDMLEKRAI